MIDVNQLRRGVTFTQDGELYKVTEYSHNKPGRGKATIKVNVRNLRTGSNLQLTYTSGDRVQDVRTEKRAVQYLYDDGAFFVFMDMETFEQTFVSHSIFGDDALYLKPELEIELLSYEKETIDYIFPTSIDYEVVESEMAIAGDRVSGATKEVTLETGLKVKTPLFVNTGDRIRVNTTTGEYITRV
ncbi:MAG: elongation factor P [Anaerolineales bacterium]|nr:elongation factor P [Anaerolineales bacterium]MCB8953362.1 elongation factor P [Ardenticatenales bacterium]